MAIFVPPLDLICALFHYFLEVLFVCIFVFSLRVGFFVCFFGLFVFSRSAPVAHGGSQARSLIRAVATGLRHSHSNVGSELHLQPTPQFTAAPDP